MKQNKPNTRAAERKLSGLTSLNQAEYLLLYDYFDECVTQKLRHYTLKGARRRYPKYREAINSSLYGSKKKLDFILMYLKENPNQLYHGQLFGMSQSKVSEWVSFLLPVLQTSLQRLGTLPAKGHSFKYLNETADYLLVDVTERQVGRRVHPEGQREEYSGKQKGHRIKNLAISDSKGYLNYMSPTFEGAVHDKAIWDQVHMHPSPVNWIADLGFLGIDKTHPNVILPYKTTKYNQLTPLQKQINQVISSLRVRIEHAFAGIKRLKIIANKIRLKSYHKRDLVMWIAAGLHNLRIQYRNGLINNS